MWGDTVSATTSVLSPWAHPDRIGAIPWSINKHLYRRLNEIERLFRRLKAFRQLFSRYDRLDVMFTAFIHFALIAEALIVGSIRVSVFRSRISRNPTHLRPPGMPSHRAEFPSPTAPSGLLHPLR